MKEQKLHEEMKVSQRYMEAIAEESIVKRMMHTLIDRLTLDQLNYAFNIDKVDPRNEDEYYLLLSSNGDNTEQIHEMEQMQLERCVKYKVNLVAADKLRWVENLKDQAQNEANVMGDMEHLFRIATNQVGYIRESQRTMYKGIRDFIQATNVAEKEAQESNSL